MLTFTLEIDVDVESGRVSQLQHLDVDGSAISDRYRGTRYWYLKPARTDAVSRASDDEATT